MRSYPYPFPPKPEVRGEDADIVAPTDIWEVVHMGDVTVGGDEIGIALWCNLPSARHCLADPVKQRIFEVVTVSMPQLYEAVGEELWQQPIRVGREPDAFICRLVKLDPVDISINTIQ